ncbi:MAG: CPBP family intramembrane metalloprotease, partial [Planctomycetaceae bacterium]|nr:CPBP family intramembrane metalloprotease [Planctomycetaceae bacterium]
EFFFRGLLQSGLCEVVGNWSKDTIGFDSGFWSNYRLAAIIIFVSILFGAAHAVTKMYFFLAFLISIYLGIIMVLFDNIIIPIIIHSLYDFLVLLLIRKKVRQIST